MASTAVSTDPCAGEQHDRDVRVVLSQRLQEVEAAEIRHHHVAEDDGRPVLRDLLQAPHGRRSPPRRCSPSSSAAAAAPGAARHRLRQSARARGCLPALVTSLFLLTQLSRKPRSRLSPTAACSPPTSFHVTRSVASCRSRRGPSSGHRAARASGTRRPIDSFDRTTPAYADRAPRRQGPAVRAGRRPSAAPPYSVPASPARPECVRDSHRAFSRSRRSRACRAATPCSRIRNHSLSARNRRPSGRPQSR